MFLGMNKIADARWKMLWRAGKLGVDSLRKLQVPSTFIPPSKKLMQQSFNSAIKGPVPNPLGTVAEKARDAVWDMGFPTSPSPQPVKDMLRILSQRKKNVEFSTVRTPGEKFTTAVNTQQPISPRQRVIQRINETGQGNPNAWSGDLNGSYVHKWNSVQVPNLRNVPQNATEPSLVKLRNQMLGVSKHEIGHAQTFQNPQLGAQYANGIIPKLKLSPQALDNPHTIPEAVGHFRATLRPDVNRASRMAMELPIEKVRQVNPQLLAQWEQEFAHLSPILKQRMLATKAHLMQNYAIS